jgi:HlyD family secretion protein
MILPAPKPDPIAEPEPSEAVSAAASQPAGEPPMHRATLRRALRLGTVVAVLAVAAVAAYRYWPGRGGETTYRFAPVARGPITAAIVASGTVNPVITVQVGSQVSGQIKALYADFNTEVKTGQLIARIDPDLFEAQAAQAQGDLDVARATVAVQEAAIAKAEADLAAARDNWASLKDQIDKARATLLDAERTYSRKERLFQQGYAPEADRDTSQTTRDAARAALSAAQNQERAQGNAVRAAEAQLATAHANLETAKAQVEQKQAVLKTAQVNLDHTYIRAPVDGTVVLRNVDVGQTVAASLQAPVLFTIAQDLRAMQVDTSVDEADVGRVRLGQRTLFNVDAFPGKNFTGEVTQIRKAPQVVQNVVTYDVVISAPNPEQLLLPGMTANVRVITDRRTDAIRIPNAALRYRPASPANGARPTQVRRASGSATVYVLDASGRPAAIALKSGITDGNFTEMVEGPLKEGQQVIVGETVPKTGTSGMPFMGGPRF